VLAVTTSMDLSCVDADGCKGGVIQWAFDYVTMNEGINTAAVYPYVGRASAVLHVNANDSLINA